MESTGPPGPRRECAFSLMELVIVLFLVGTLALLAVPQFQRAILEYEVDRAAAEVRTLTRYARSLALTGVSHAAVFETVNDRILVQEADSGTPAPDPMRKHQDCVLQLGAQGRFEHVTMESADFLGEARVTFDPLGNASRNGTVVLSAGEFQRTVRVEIIGGRTTIE